MTQQLSGSVTVRRRDNRVEIINNETHIGIALIDYQRALDFAKVLRYQARGVYAAAKTSIDKQLSVRREGDTSIIEVNDTTFIEMPVETALEIGNAIQSKAKELEEEALSEDVAYDQAVLIRAGKDMPLTNNQHILNEAYKEAQYGSLRKYMPAPPKWNKYGKLQVVRGEKDNASN